MHDEISDIFTEYENTGIPEVIQNLNSDDPNMHIITYSQKDSVHGRITTLSELFLEWYLFDSSTTKDIKAFLETENLTDIFTETDFMNLMCGNAYLDENLILYLHKKLPFIISVSKLNRMNQNVQNTTPDAYLIKSTENTIAKTRDLIKQHKNEHRNNVKKAKKKYRETHREQIAEYDRQYRKTHPEKIKQIDAKRRQAHLAERRQRDKEYYAAHRDECRQRNHERYEKNKEQIKQRARERYAKAKAARLEQLQITK